MKLYSPAFTSDFIPVEYTCLGENIYPPLFFTDVPIDTKSLVLIFEDLDAIPIWTHWLLYNLLPTGDAIQRVDLKDASQGLANNNSIGYEGPCPKYFSLSHTYRFTLYALNRLLEFETVADRNIVEQEMEGAVLTTAYLEVTCSLDDYNVVS